MFSFEGSGATSIVKAVQPLRDLGVKTFIIAVNSNPKDLLPAVETSRDLTLVKSFGDLQPLTPPLSRHIASGKFSISSASKHIELEILW